MPQLLAKYNTGALAWAEIADAILDPSDSFYVAQDFIDAGAVTVTSNAAVAGPLYTVSSVNASTNVGAFALNSAHGGTGTITTNATTTANDNIAVASNADFLTVAAGRRGYFEARVSGVSVSTGFAVGLTSATPGTSVFSSSAIAVPADSVMIGRDAGTDSLTGAVANRTFQLCVRGSNGSMTETILVVPATISTSAFYNFGFLIGGTEVQAYINGIKVGAVARYDNSSGTPGAMGWMAAANAPATTQASLAVDYVVVSGTR
jgi:hypothetical protein